MSDIGIKVSQAGKDVKECADQELLFSSSWPTFGVLFEADVSLDGLGTPQLLFEHNLGYPPAFLVYINNPNSLIADSPTFGASSYSNDTGIYSLSTVVTTAHVVVFNHNLKTNYTAPIVRQTETAQKAYADMGIKISVEGKDIMTCELKDQAINSGGRTPMIHQTGYGRLNDFEIVDITHNLGYIPMFLTYFDDAGNGNYYLRRATDATSPTAGLLIQEHVTTQKIVLNGMWTMVGYSDYAYIIFKDPTVVA